ncbi:MAG TPA: 8-amino-7-oxononanoate synthase [Humidesulfovibrio sp.]|uniref:aminotransferase class I/II-fold pyridoxal phosphate-dependent enzyme n=1 Tax=Humidesulfovibrio sp. TaxID=2910988 RepID=UPI002CB63D06|nr:8-amino-7-oxononanoate synthase [Humidesulfovibrio sp.]HWR04476.1 8-amino-7-oxononanoate synthase [Humidesulfovibrio sp.]
MNELLRRYADVLESLDAQGLLRRLPPSDKDGLLDFSGNDYMGLARRPELVAAAAEAGRLYGAGATGSRLLSGNTPAHEAFEARIAADKGSEAALIFNSGYQANAACIAALLDATALGAEPLVFADKLNHASMHLGCALAGARQLRYRHLDLEHLKALLEKHASEPRPKVILSESVFGMDGDQADIAALQDLALAHGALLYIDEAHATGVFGPRGYGLCEAVDLAPTTVVMGTMSKALGVSGGYVACAGIIRDYLVNKAGGFIFSTAPSPLTVGAGLKSWELLPGLGAERTALLHRAEALRQGLRRLGLDPGQSTTHIVPVILGTPERTLAAKDALAGQGIVVSAVRPPTVPQGASRLRIGLSAAHTDADIARLLGALGSL